MAKSNTKKYVAVIAIVLVGAYFLFVDDSLLSDNGVATPQITTKPADDTAKTNAYEGPITIRFPASDALDPAISYGEDTELDIILYRLNSDGSFNKLTTPSSAEIGVATVTSSKDLKTVYAEYSVSAGQDYYIDASSIKTLNSRSAGNPQWLDLNNDGRPTYVFPIDITGFPPVPAIQPQFDFTVELIDEGTFALDSPADVDVTDTGKQRCNIKWSLDATASGDGAVVTRIRATTNSTITSEWDPLQSNISFPTGSDPNSAKQKIYFSEFVPTELASTYRYDYTFGNGDISDGHLLKSPLNGETQFEVPVEFWVNMDVVPVAIELTLNIQTIDAHGNYNDAISDAVICS